VWVYTNTAVLAYNPSVIMSLFQSHWSTTRLCGCTLYTAILAYDLSMIMSFLSRCTMTHLCGCTLTLWFWPMIKIIVALHNEMIMCNACSPSLWWPMRLCPGDPSPSLHHMNHLDIGNGHHRVVVQSSSKDPLVGVGLLSHLAVIHY
jgi:hypothetical protein